jgi:hypothetical protein
MISIDYPSDESLDICFNKLEDEGVQSCMGLEDWTHIAPSMHSFMSPKKVKFVVFLV